MKDIVVQLIRRFVPITAPSGDWDNLASAPGGRPLRWHELEEARRVLILADPGAARRSRRSIAPSKRSVPPYGKRLVHEFASQL
jgi:hypothetical protein